MPAVKNVGEPCAGEPHARIDGGREETRSQSATPRDTGRLSPTRPASSLRRSMPPRNGGMLRFSTCDFAPALGEFFGTKAGVSASTVNRLTEAWQAEHAKWSERDLQNVDYVYMWGTACTSTSVWKRTGCAAWSSSAYAPTGRKSWWRWLTATASPPTRGPKCCEAVGSKRPSSRSATSARVLGRAARGVPTDQGATLLGARDRKRS
jgi:hypothetical protein